MPESMLAPDFKGTSLQKSKALPLNTSSYALPTTVQGDALTCPLACCCQACGQTSLPCFQEAICTSISWCPTILPSISIHSRNSQTSISWIQLCKSSGIMIATLTWATSSSGRFVASTSGGLATNVQMATCTAGQQLSVTGAMAMVVLSAAAAKFARTTL